MRSSYFTSTPPPPQAFIVSVDDDFQGYGTQQVNGSTKQRSHLKGTVSQDFRPFAHEKTLPRPNMYIAKTVSKFFHFRFKARNLHAK